ncbi:hypothetical protein ElyMa_005245400 [Elysia marginata]|uniref:Uncharacterized protein n=1 Tax=Elysia marginata TaxID=1093978 RepID=A0AAV4JWY4_9GAST|nr:hypothetical protein ElyMa_005245400 [Elysia marginata]
MEGCIHLNFQKGKVTIKEMQGIRARGHHFVLKRKRVMGKSCDNWVWHLTWLKFLKGELSIKWGSYFSCITKFQEGYFEVPTRTGVWADRDVPGKLRKSQKEEFYRREIAQRVGGCTQEWAGCPKTKHLHYNGTTGWASFAYQFNLVAGKIQLTGSDKINLLASTLSGKALEAVAEYVKTRDYNVNSTDVMHMLERTFDRQLVRSSPDWQKLEEASQQQWEILHEWADHFRDIGKRILEWNRDAALVIEQKLVMQFCLGGWTKMRVFERGPPPTLEKAVEEMYWFRKVNSTFVGSNRESQVCGGGWSSPEREYRLCNEGRASSGEGMTGMRSRDTFLRKGGIGPRGRNLTTPTGCTFSRIRWL